MKYSQIREGKTRLTFDPPTPPPTHDIQLKDYYNGCFSEAAYKPPRDLIPLTDFYKQTSLSAALPRASHHLSLKGMLS